MIKCVSYTKRPLLNIVSEIIIDDNKDILVIKKNKCCIDIIK